MTTLRNQQEISKAEHREDINSKSVTLVNDEGTGIDVQNPLPTDGDSVYCKDIWVDESIVANWDDIDSAEEDIICIPFTGLHTRIQNTTSDNHKTLRVHFKRTISAHQVGIGCSGGGDYSNVKVSLLGSGEVPRTVVDDSGNNTKYTSNNYEFEPQLFNALQLEFLTTDDVTLSNITIQKAMEVNSFIKLQIPDKSIVAAQGTTKGNFKTSVEEFDDTFYDNPLPIMKGFNIPLYDDIVLSYTGDDLTGVVYKLLTVTVATLTLSYTSVKLTGVVHT